jgi:hypothetical protein
MRPLGEADPRRLLPRPVFDPAQRSSGYPAYVSPRPARVHARVREAQSWLSWGQRRMSSRQEDFLQPHGWRAVQRRTRS